MSEAPVLAPTWVQIPELLVTLPLSPAWAALSTSVTTLLSVTQKGKRTQCFGLNTEVGREPLTLTRFNTQLWGMQSGGVVAQPVEGEPWAGLLTTPRRPCSPPGTGPGGSQCPAGSACEERRGSRAGRAPGQSTQHPLSRPSWVLTTHQRVAGEKAGTVPSAGRTKEGAPPNQKGPFQTLLLGPRSPGRPEGLLDARSQAHLAPASETEENPMSESPE